MARHYNLVIQSLKIRKFKYDFKIEIHRIHYIPKLIEFFKLKKAQLWLYNGKINT